MKGRAFIDSLRDQNGLKSDFGWPEGCDLLADAEANDGSTPETDKEATRTDGDLPHVNGYVDADFARALERRCSGLAAEVGRLRGVLRELLETTLSQMPPHEAGKDAQDTWADRRAKARNDAAAIDAERAK
jgi:hypothetical protein